MVRLHSAASKAPASGSISIKTTNLGTAALRSIADRFDLKSWAVEPIVYSLIPIIETFASGAELIRESFRQQVAERISELPPPRDWTELPPRPDLAFAQSRCHRIGYLSPSPYRALTARAA